MPQLVLLDINMPKLNGLEVLKMVREEYGDTPPPFIVMLTTSQHESDLGNAITGGADAFSVKPNEPSKMTDIIKAVKILFVQKDNLPSELAPVFQFLKE